MTGGILSVPLYLERHEQKGVADMDYQTMKEIPGPDRPYERCERLGPEALTDAELLYYYPHRSQRRAFPLSGPENSGLK